MAAAFEEIPPFPPLPKGGFPKGGKGDLARLTAQVNSIDINPDNSRTDL
jgi:hypothetical protein